MSDDGRRTVPNLAKAREDADMTQGRLAAAAGLSEKTVRRAEGGKSVSAETRAALRAVLGSALDVSQLDAPQVAMVDVGDYAPPRTGKWRPVAVVAVGAAMVALFVVPGVRLLLAPLPHKVVVRMFDIGHRGAAGAPRDMSVTAVSVDGARDVAAALAASGARDAGQAVILLDGASPGEVASVTHSQAYVREVAKAPCAQGQAPVGDECLVTGVWQVASRLTAERSMGAVTFRLTDDAMRDVSPPDAVPGTLSPSVTTTGGAVTVSDDAQDVVVARLGDTVIVATNASSIPRETRVAMSARR